MEANGRTLFLPQPERRLKILMLQQQRHERFAFWSAFLSYSAWSALVSGLFGLLVCGFWLRALPLFWVALSISLLLGLAAAGASFYLSGPGALTPWLHFSGEVLEMEDEALVYRLSALPLLPFKTARTQYVWVLPYANLLRMEYDRSAKLLRLFGRFDESRCVKPPEPFSRLPRGMRFYAHPERRPAQDFYIDLPLYYGQSQELLQNLEEKAGCFIHPALRGDDYADLQELPGARKPFPMTRVMSLFLALLLTAGSTTALWLQRYLEDNPWQPYPPTALETLVKTHQPGDTVILDGCRVTMERAVPGKDGGVRVSMVWENQNKAESLLLHLGLQNGNIAAYALRPGEDGKMQETLCAYIPPREQQVLITPGGVRSVELLFQTPEDTTALRVVLNSDRWASHNRFWEPEYLGRPITVNGEDYWHNQVVFELVMPR